MLSHFFLINILLYQPFLNKVSLAVGNLNNIETFCQVSQIYDGLFLMSLLYFEDYPLDKLSLIATMMNPVDLSRVLILLKLDISALLGYTGAVFQKFFGTNFGVILSFIMLVVWVVVPTFFIWRIAKKKDF